MEAGILLVLCKCTLASSCCWRASQKLAQCSPPCVCLPQALNIQPIQQSLQRGTVPGADTLGSFSKLDQANKASPHLLRTSAALHAVLMWQQQPCTAARFCRSLGCHLCKIPWSGTDAIHCLQQQAQQQLAKQLQASKQQQALSISEQDRSCDFDGVAGT